MCLVGQYFQLSTIDFYISFIDESPKYRPAAKPNAQTNKTM